MNDIIAALITWAVMQTGYSLPAEPPTIRYLPTHEFAKQVCPHGAQCSVKGYYADGSGTIVLHEVMRDLVQNRRARAMLVHEIVHYLQDYSGRWEGEKTCQIWVEREREAYLGPGNARDASR